MNHLYRSIWNHSIGAVVVVSGHGLRSLAVGVALTCGSASYASPEGGTVVAGNASITSTAGNTTINQSSQNAVLNWQSFNIGSGETVSFVQPNSNSVALNRVLGADPSNILGSLSANGKVFLINPNGILFGAGAQVNVGSLVASTRNITDNDFLTGQYHFDGAGEGGIVNQGWINAAGGYVALLGANVSNQGVIAAKLGSVVLAAGNAITLDVAGDGLLNVTVNTGAVNALVQNGGLIQADGGQVLLTAQSAGSLLQSAVNNTGLIQAQSIENRNGVIKLLGDMQSGTVNAGGTLDAGAPNGGDGGFVETSAAHVQIASDASITTAAPQGTTGQWLIDPVDFTIAASGGDITGALLTTSLGASNVIIQSSSGAAGVDGDINVNDTVTWSANRLTLNAYRNININTAMNGSGTASLALLYGQGAVAAGNTGTVNILAPVNLASGNNLGMKRGSDGAVVNYTVINDMTALQNINGNLSGRYALGSNLNAAGVSGFVPIGTITSYDDAAHRFSGAFDGLGHTISNLTINRPSNNYVGLFGGTETGSTIKNLGLVNVSVTGLYEVGSLVGFHFGTVSNSYAVGTVTGLGDVGGLIGYSSVGKIANSYANATVATGPNYDSAGGGLIGYNYVGTIDNSYATGSVTAAYAGGLAGVNNGGTINNSYASGLVSRNLYGNSPGGLVGRVYNGGVVNNSYWNSTTSGQASSAGGTALTSTQMQQQSNFAGWDFSTVWIGYDGHTNPLLRNFMTPLTVTANSATKTYDGLTYSGGNGVNYSTTPNGNLLGSLSYGGTAQGAKNAGTYTLAGSGLYSNQQGYIINYVNSTLTIDKAALTATATAANKVYDGNTSASATLNLLGLVGSETLNADSTASFNTKDVTSANLVTVNSITLINGSNGGLASNYSIASGQTAAANITAKPLTATVIAQNKIYDGNTAAVATFNGLSGLVGSETVNATATASFNSKEVAGANLVTVNSIALADGSNGGVASNYSLASGQTVGANITPKSLTVVGQTALNKVYDGTTTATLTGGSLAGVVAGETVLLNAAGAFVTAEVGNDIVVTAANSLDGIAAANYTLIQPIGLSANIVPTAGYQNTAGHVLPDSQRVPGASPLDSPLVGLSSVMPTSYDFTGLNLTIISRGIDLSLDMQGQSTQDDQVP